MRRVLQNSKDRISSETLNVHRVRFLRSLAVISVPILFCIVN
jgi:hypothetical protein